MSLSTYLLNKHFSLEKCLFFDGTEAVIFSPSTGETILTSKACREYLIALASLTPHDEAIKKISMHTEAEIETLLQRLVDMDILIIGT